jgi:hypothetical protein
MAGASDPDREGDGDALGETATVGGAGGEASGFGSAASRLQPDRTLPRSTAETARAGTVRLWTTGRAPLTDRDARAGQTGAEPP